MHERNSSAHLGQAAKTNTEMAQETKQNPSFERNIGIENELFATCKQNAS